MIIETSREYFSILSFRHRALKHFVAIWTTLPRQMWRPEVWKSIATFTPTSQQIEILVEKREKFLNAGYEAFIVSMCDTKFV